jgi:Ca2+-binding RTX toxin-like protein
LNSELGFLPRDPAVNDTFDISGAGVTALNIVIQDNDGDTDISGDGNTGAANDDASDTDQFVFAEAGGTTEIDGDLFFLESTFTFTVAGDPSGAIYTGYHFETDPATGASENFTILPPDVPTGLATVQTVDDDPDPNAVDYVALSSGDETISEVTPSSLDLTGNDTVIGGAGGDTIDGGIGNDTIYGDTGPGEPTRFDVQYYEINTGISSLSAAGFDAVGNNTNPLTAQFVRDDLDVNEISLENGGNGSTYAVRFETTLTVTEGGDYTFTTSSDDGSQLFIDGALVVNNDGVHGLVTETGTQTLGPGEYNVVIIFFENSGGDTLAATISGPDTGDLPLDLTEAAIDVSDFGDDEITGGDGADIIFGQGGDDEIMGDDGADTIEGGAGIDTIFGGDGADIIDGGTGADDIFGGIGNDTIQGGAGGDTIFGDGDNDTIVGGAGADYIEGGDGTDTISGGLGGDTIFGNDGVDTIQGGAGIDVIDGGEGNDIIFGDEGDDEIDGGLDDDVIEGGGGSDTIDGGDGEDTIYGDTAAPVSPALFNVEYFEFNSGLSNLDDAGFDNVGTNSNTPTSTSERDDLLVNMISSENGGNGATYAVRFETTLTVTAGGDYTFTTTSDDGSQLFVNDELVVQNDGLHGSRERDGETELDPGEYKVVIIFFENSGGDSLSATIQGPDTANAKLNILDANISAPAPAGNDIIDGGDGDDTIDGGGQDDLITVGAGDTAAGGDDDDTFVLDFAQTSSSGSNTITIDGGTDGDTDVDTLDLTGLGRFTITSQTTDLDGDSTSGLVTFDDGGQTVVFTEIENLITCFTKGTLIETQNGPTPIEQLRAGDMVLTMDDGFQPVRWIGSTNVDETTLTRQPRLKPIRICAGALGAGMPADDLLVSPQHRVFIRSKVADRIFGHSEVLVPANKLVSCDGIDAAIDVVDVSYWHLLFDKHQIIWSNGAPTESLFTGPQAMLSVSAEARAEIATLFPHILASDFAPTSARMIPAKGKYMMDLARRHQKNEKDLITFS